MKKLFIVLLTALLLSDSMYAQFMVDSLGHVSVGIDDEETTFSKFAINSRGLSSACAHIKAPNETYGLYVNAASEGLDPIGPLPAGDRAIREKYGIYSLTDPISPGYNYAIYGKSYLQNGQPTGYAYGVYGIAGGGTTGRNYGVLGTLFGSQSGAGIYGSSTSGDKGVTISGQYAGYFRGNVRVTESLTASTVYNTSDFRLKENISELDESALNAVEKMNVVQFNYKQREVETAEGKQILYEEESDLLKRRHYGLIAQDLKEIYPDLVMEDAEGYLAVNYIELVPILIRSIQELRAELQTNKKANMLRGTESSTGVTDVNVLQAVLFQNDPNPFSEQTTVSCIVPEEIKVADIYIYDMNGTQLAKYPIEGRGHTQAVIKGNSLTAGMYIYSLITDGKVTDTKRMILTK